LITLFVTKATQLNSLVVECWRSRV